MNICIFSDVTIGPHRGGMPDYTYWAARSLTERGHRVLCITTCAVPCAPDVAGTLAVLQAGAADLPAQVTALLQKHGVQLLWMHTLQPHDVAMCRSACDAVGAKLVCHLHVNPTYQLAGYTDCLAENWYDFCRGRRRMVFLYALLRYVPCYVKRIVSERRRYLSLYRQADAIILLSERFRREFCRMTGLSRAPKLRAVSNPLLVIPEGGPQEKLREVLHVGRLPWQQKRVDRLLKAWSLLEAQFPDWCLTIVGDGGGRERYEEIARLLGLQRVRFEGKQNPARYYERARIFCLTSSFEGFGLVLTEAQAAGCVPVVFESYAAVHDIVEDGVNGCLVKPYDIAAYADALKGLMSDEPRRAAMGEAARKSVARFSSEVIIGQVEALFEELTSRR